MIIWLSLLERNNKRLPSNSSCLFLGVTFKENVPDLRNSKSLELIRLLRKKIFKFTFMIHL